MRRSRLSLLGAGFAGAADVGHKAVVGDETNARPGPTLAETHRFYLPLLNEAVDVRDLARSTGK